MARITALPACVVLLGVALTLPVLTQAETSRTAALTPADISQVKELEEILVAGDRNSLHAARRAVADAEDRFYARYNAVNDDHAYDVLCRDRAPTGSLIERRICLPRLVEDAIEADTQRMMQTSNGLTTVVAPDLLHASVAPELKRRMLAQVKKDPELLRALLEHARLQQHYEALRKRKFEDHWLVWD
jgi:hypothetical protein